MSRYVVRLEEIDRAQIAVVGGKAARLGDLTHVSSLRIPPGFCVSTQAFRRVLADAAVGDRLERLARLSPRDRAAIAEESAALRAVLEGVVVPQEIANAITHALADLGSETPCAVRSSATAEDLPSASFAGQQDTFLDVVGADAIIHHVRRCWASLFTERAVTYRLRNRFARHEIEMGVLVQKMVPADAAGVAFTADPVNSNRTITSIEATLGLGESLVGGLVNPDEYKVRRGAMVARRTQRGRAALSDAQVLELERVGRTIEAHFGSPQDIEWCLAAGAIHVVQARPITTVFPIPDANDDGPHVYLSVGHQQMMTDAMKPLGLSLWQMTTLRPMKEAGGRLWVDVTKQLASPAARTALLAMIGKADPLFHDALRTIVERGFVPSQPDPAIAEPALRGAPLSTSLEADRSVVTDLIGRNAASVATSKREIASKSGPALFDFIVEDLKELKRFLFDPESHRAIMEGMEAAWWLDEHLEKWLGEPNASFVLTQSVDDNVTSEMGLALLDVADAIRPFPAVVAFLQSVRDDDDFFERLDRVEGGAEARAAIEGYLSTYGMRCVGEIDVTRPRWSERPTTLVPMILADVKAFGPGERARRFERGRAQAEEKERDLLARLRLLPGGEARAAETKRKIDRVRTFAGYREYPKYGMIARYFLYRKALLAEGTRLVRENVLLHPEDIFFLRFSELHEVARTGRADAALIRERRAAFRSYETLVPPRLITSEGERIDGSYLAKDAPAGALVGLPVSNGIVEGRARVVTDVAAAELEPGDILVTTFTDPSFSPLFVAIAGLVTEVGGTMTHGAVVAREYGLPAVVGVDQATRRIRDGQRIRVNGTSGYVEILA